MSLLVEILIPNDLPLKYYSQKNKTTNNTSLCVQFLILNNTPSNYQSKEFCTIHRNDVQEIAECNKLWGWTASEEMIEFREYVANKWFIVSSNTQMVKHWVKDSNKYTLSGKD